MALRMLLCPLHISESSGDQYLSLLQLTSRHCFTIKIEKLHLSCPKYKPKQAETRDISIHVQYILGLHETQGYRELGLNIYSH